MVITFAGALRLYCVYLKQNSSAVLTALCCCWTLNTIEPLSVTARSRVVSTSTAIFSSLIDGCLKYKNKEKPKTGPRPDPRLNYDVTIGPKPGPRGVKKSGPIGAGLKCRALAFPSVEITFPPRGPPIVGPLESS